MSKNRKLLDMLLDLHRNRSSGVLRIERGSEKKQLIVNDGLLGFAESNLQEDHLARIMVGMGLLQRDKLREVAALMKNGKTSEEAIHAVTASNTEALEKARREQAINILASLWAWNSCTILLYPNSDLMKNRLDLQMSLPELLVFSVRQAISNRLIRIPSGLLQNGYSIADNMEEIVALYPLNSAETSIYSLLQQSRNAADSVSQILPPVEKPEEILFRLSLLGLIKTDETQMQTETASKQGESNSIVIEIEDMLMRFETASLYEILALPDNPRQDEIQAAYHDLAKKFHPDRFQSKDYSTAVRRKVEQLFGLVNEAYATLRNPASRADYDEKRLKKEGRVEAAAKAKAGGEAEKETMAAALFEEGRNLLAKRDFDKAVERLRGCVWLKPDKAAYHHYLGVAMAKIPAHRKSAEQHLLKALELDTTSINSHLELAELYMAVNLLRKAERQLHDLMQWDPENPKALKLLAELKKIAS
jgi:curved DNA-binding protein CbpA